MSAPTAVLPALVPVKNGWLAVAVGEGWAARGSSESEALNAFAESVAWHADLDMRWADGRSAGQEKM